MTVDVDVVVIGAGPAGMSCSGVLAQHNVNVVVLDEQNAPGGQIYKNIEGVTEKRAADLDFLGKSYAEGIEIANRFRAEDIDYRPGSSVWQISSSVIGKRRELIYSCGGKSQKLMAKYIVLATGAIERPIPVPGWTLPGVMTAGALQSLLKTSAVYPTGKLVIAGSGPLPLQLISQLMDANIEIAAFVDTTPAGSLFRAAFHLPRALLAPEYLKRGWHLVRKLKKSGIKMYSVASNLEIIGDQKATGLSFTSRGSRYNIEADVIALHEGVIPNTQTGRLLNIEHQWDNSQNAFRPVLDGYGETSVAGVFAAGDNAGILGAKSAVLSGEITGCAIVEKLGFIKESARDLIIEEAKLRRFMENGVRPMLEALYPAPDWISSAENETIICRCEEVLAGDLRKIVADGCPGPNQAKAFLRCGMGTCHGRMCASTVTEIIAKELKRPPNMVGSYNIRPPIKPISLGELASLNEG